ncbi:MAG: zinc metallopeptidase [Oleibacter sp.]|nr:zinc metallopeptidase [Thalassolituus sp.]
MRWEGRRKSQNIEDRRSNSRPAMAGMGAAGSLLRLIPLVYRILGPKGTIIAGIAVLGYGLFTGNLGGLLGLQNSPSATNQNADQNVQQSPSEKKLVDFVSVVLADTEETWTAIFRAKGLTYKEPKLVLFRNSVSSACGMAQSATGPFYCPSDQQVYIDLGFYDQLKNQLNAPGDFAQAYVIAHEVGHHVQTLLGISEKVHAARRQMSTLESNKLSVKQELQADCFAGVWAHHADNSRQLLESGDIEEGLNAASAIGDDTLQKQSRGTVSPDSFTHGSAAQRVQWFKTGLKSGDTDSCNTFG